VALFRASHVKNSASNADVLYSNCCVDASGCAVLDEFCTGTGGETVRAIPSPLFGLLWICALISAGTALSALHIFFIA
jgi:hypothetical protein